MKAGIKSLFFLLCILISASCGPLSNFKNFIEPDIAPPCLLGIRTLSSSKIELEFDEAPYCDLSRMGLNPNIDIMSVFTTGTLLIIETSGQRPGKNYMLEAMIKDEKGNSVSFLASFYGFNPDVPRLLINEFTTRGTGNHPDVVELKVLDCGNMGGVSLYQGTPGNWKNRLIFPSFPVAAGDFLLIHFKPSGSADEVDETQEKDISGGLDASDEAFDFWIREGTGISGNNGVLSLYDRPGGDILDGVLYSNRTSSSDEYYHGFGTRDTMERAEELVLHGGWMITESRVRPEDGVSPEGSTGTRSICRSSLSEDTDYKTDWHIVPTRGSTFGRDNSDEIYQ